MAKLTEYLANWFRPKDADVDQYYDDEPVTVNNLSTTQEEPVAQFQPLASTENQQILSNLNAPQKQEITPIEVTIPYWLDDEDTLRDEGVLFGLSESDPNEKTDIIQKYFSNLAAGHIAVVEEQNERIQELNLFIGQKNNRIEELLTH